MEEINYTAKSLKKHLERLIKKQDKLTKDINATFTELKSICEHDETFKQDKYDSGDYYNTSKYHTLTVCKICGEVLNIKTTSGGFE